MFFKKLIGCLLLTAIGSMSANAAVYNIVSYEDLNTKSQSAESGSTLNIIGDIFADDNFNSFTKESLTIQSGSSKKHIIEGQGNRGFVINNPQGDYTFKNLKITGFSSALEFGKGSLKVENIDFSNNSLSGSNSSDARGSTINLNNSKQSAYINNSNFISNKLSSTGDAMGGVIFSNAKVFDISNTNFNDNFVESGGGTFGGVIFADGEQTASNSGYILNINDSTFKNNNVKASYLAAGGAVQAQNLDEFNVNNTKFENNNISADLQRGEGAGGGALSIADVGKTVISNSQFINNSVVGYKLAEGGAIDVNSDITVINSDFIGNSVKSDVLAIGGAISNFGTLSLIADGKDVLFDKNTANDISNAIYNGDDSVINLNAVSGSKIIFNDSITSDDSVMNINKKDLSYPSDGNIVLNADMSGYLGEVNVYGGTIQLGENGTLFENSSKLTLNDGSNIDLRNGASQTTSIGSLVLNGTTSVSIDADFLSDSIDNFNIADATGTGSFKITDINMIYDTSIESGHIDKAIVTGSNVNVALENSLQTILTKDSKYEVSLNGSSLTIDKSKYLDGLAGAVGISGERQYHMSSDEVINEWSAPTESDVQGTALVIKGNQNAISGNGNSGMSLNSAQSLTLEDVSLISGFSSEKGGAILNDNGIVNVIASSGNVVFANNKAGNTSNAIHTNGGELNFNASSNSSIIFNDKITSEGTNGTININAHNSDVSSVASNAPASGVVELNNDMSGFKGDVNLYHGTIKVGENGTFFNPQNFNIYGCTLDFSNGVIQNHSLGNLSISDHVDMKVDADLNRSVMDSISASNKITDSGKINVTQINLLSDSYKNKTSIGFADENLKGTVTYSGSDISYSPMYKYNVRYDENTGRFDFSQFSGGGNNYHNYNPSVFAGSVAAQIGGYLSQLNSYDQAFMNIDMKMLMPKELREALKYKNKYAYDGNTPMVFSPLFYQEQEKGAWFRPYSAFESVGLKNGPRVSNVMYGTFMGVDSDMYDLGHGFEGQLSIYAGYNGSHQAFDGVSLYQNGGNLGFTGALFKGNFFSALTANAGASSVDSSHMMGSENFPMIMAGVASKTGYNWELFKGKFIIQPNYMMSYTFVNAFNFRNGGGVDISSDPLNAIQIAPGIKFIGNTKSGWQPYIGVNMVWNIIDKSKFKAFDTSLPELSVKPFIEYGVGVQKLWGEKFTGFAQAMLRNGGRNGIALSLGFRWAFGKSPESSNIKSQLPLKELSPKINLQCLK